jgi:hypothetical protein
MIYGRECLQCKNRNQINYFPFASEAINILPQNQFGFFQIGTASWEMAGSEAVYASRFSLQIRAFCLLKQN